MANEMPNPYVPKVGDRVLVESCRCENKPCPVVGKEFTISSLRASGYVDFAGDQCGLLSRMTLRPLPASPATPPDVAAPGDRLLESRCCCLCDKQACIDPRNGYSGSFNSRELGTVYFCHAHWLTKWSAEEVETARSRRAHQTPPAPEKWEPKVGEMCEGAGISTGFLCSGPFVRFVENTAILKNDGHIYLEWVVTRASLRPASPSQSATAPKGEGERKVEPRVVIWNDQRKIEFDPYTEHRTDEQPDGDRNVTDIGNRSMRQTRIAALSTGDELSQLAARRQRQRGALLGEMDRGPERRAEVKHPASWPEGACDDADELFATHGSGR